MILFPKKIQIETTILCNSKCSFCPQDELKRGPNYMSDDIWRKIIDETRGRDVIYRPFLVNEPFVDKRLGEIINYIRLDDTASVELNSNGRFVNRALVTEALKEGIDWIRFSIDGFSPETYKESGRGTNYNKVIDDIHFFINERNRLKSDCLIEIRMINMDFNRHEQADFTEYWSKYLDKVSVTELYSWPWTGQTESFNAPCPKINDEMFFVVDGRAILCCWDTWEKAVIGDVRENTVEEIWLGETNQKYRSLLNNGERSRIELCSRCDAYKNYDFTNWQGY
ncbi:radical SAM/SPASM domain-containing protein [candidate division KSB1 bacterium]